MNVNVRVEAHIMLFNSKFNTTGRLAYINMITNVTFNKINIIFYITRIGKTS